ncbi:hypothetical protein C0989_007491 [Termitomyces sp. Mn162]|nr:hypothetical protein C0989_007491 [Termitomyces sp. Mn162]
MNTSLPHIEVSLDNGSIHEDFSSQPQTFLHNNLLSPHTPRPPSSTTAVESGDDRSSLSNPPPSPTLSARSSLHSGQSVRFVTSTDLRNNDPERGYGHSRRPSSASGTTIPDDHDVSSREHSDIGHDTLRVESTTPTVFSGSNLRKGNKKKGAISEADEQTAYQRELEQDRNFNPQPFSFRPFQLAHLVNPPRVLEAMGYLGGTQALLKGLGTDGEKGLSKEALSVNSGALVYQAAKDQEQRDREKAEKKKKKKGWQWRWRWGKGAGQGASQRHETQSAEEEEEQEWRVEQEKRKEQEHSIPIPEPSPNALSASVDERRRVYGPNLLPTRPTKSLLFLMWVALKDKVLVLLSVAAVISLALGLFQDFGTPRPEGEPPVDWVEGVAIMVAVAIVVSPIVLPLFLSSELLNVLAPQVIVGSLNDWQKERQFKQLNDKKEERGIKVIRDGVECFIDSKEVVVGDIALLEPGEVVPCDGVFLSGQHVRCDEAGATGESDAMRKLSYEECMEFIKRALQSDSESTPLQLKLNALAELIAKFGSIAGGILFAALLIRFFVQLGQNNPVRTASEKGIAFVNILIISVTLVVVAVPEGLPLAVTLALAFATKRMTYENLLVRILGSCEIMANASVVCTDKTGTLTQNLMTVVAGSIGHAKFVRNLHENSARHNAHGKDDKDSDIPPEIAGERKNRDDFSIDQAELNNALPPALRELFNEAIAVNSTAFEDHDTKTGQLMFVGSKTETALLQFAKELGWRAFRETREAAHVVQMIPFSSQRKAMCVVVKLPDNAGYRAYLKGASELLSKSCTKHVVVRPPASEKGWEGQDRIEVKAIDGHEAENINRTIIFYANQTLRTIALCYRDFEQWPPKGMEHNEENEVEFLDLAQDLTLIGITGIEDPLRQGVREAVAKCHHAGVTVKMCTGDNVLTARSIALQCGIFTPGGIIMEGPHFRRLTKADRIEIVPRLQVLARSSPEDKEVLVKTLKSLGEIVGVTGDGTNDGPALKEANVGFSMGIAGTEVAKEASDIILMDDNFASIVKAIMWGRCVNDAVRKFLQFQLSTNVTAVVITFVSAVASTEEASVLTAVQLLWINIIMDTFAALALATDPASESLLDRHPDKKTTPLFTTDMYKQIFIQSIYQIIVILIFHFLGLRILGLKLTGNSQDDKHTNLIVQTLVFNAFVFAQIFNSLNCRRLDRKLNVCEGIFKNRYFLEILVQVLIVFVGGDAFQVTRIGGREWGISLALGVVSLPLGMLIRLLPNEPFERVFKKVGFLGKPEVLPTVSAEGEAWSNTVNIVRQNLGTFMNIRGGRTRSSSIVTRGKLVVKRSDSDVKLPKPTSSLMAMVPSLVAGAVAAGQRTVQGSLSDPASHDPSRSSAALMEGHLRFHPDTPHDDPMFKRYGAGNQHLD